MSRGIHVITKSCTNAHIEANLAAIELVDRVPEGCLADADGSEMVGNMNNHNNNNRLLLDLGRMYEIYGT